MIETTEQYLNKITDEHIDKPKFLATVKLIAENYVDVQNFLWELIAAYDVDEAEGEQLDAIGLWVGASRIVDVPLAGVYFEWDTTTSEGWDSGVWIKPGDPENGVEVLGDDQFRSLIKAKIIANKWKGYPEGAYEIIDAAFTADPPILIVDNQNQTQTVKITAGSISAINQALITQGYLPIKPAGIRQINEII